MTGTQIETFSALHLAQYADVFGDDTPKWLRRAMELYEAHSIPNDEYELQGQYTENRMFIRRLEQDRQKGLLRSGELMQMEEAFAKACADPEGDPMLALEHLYLQHFDARQHKHRSAPAAAVAGI